MGHLYHGYVSHNQRVVSKLCPPIIKHGWLGNPQSEWTFVGSEIHPSLVDFPAMSDETRGYISICLVVYLPTPLKNDGVRHLGLYYSILVMESHNPFHGSSHHQADVLSSQLDWNNIPLSSQYSYRLTINRYKHIPSGMIMG